MAAAAHLVGQHDFRSFCSNKKMKKSTVRTIYSLDIATMGPELCGFALGRRLLYNMVRILVGAFFPPGG
ncbi:MAG: hypothetical protein ACLSHU_03845 [Oscillospiraceae bacterium]